MTISVAVYFDYLGIWSGFEQYKAYNNRIQKKIYIFSSTTAKCCFWKCQIKEIKLSCLTIFSCAAITSDCQNKMQINYIYIFHYAFSWRRGNNKNNKIEFDKLNYKVDFN